MALSRIADHNARYVLHDLISPISSLKLNLELLTQHSDLRNKKVKYILNVMNFGLNTLTSIINWKFEKEENFQLKNTINEAFQFFEKEYQAEGIELKLDINNNYFLFGYKIHFLRILVNFFSNSLQALSASRKKIKYVMVRSYVKNKFLIVDFIDNGPGFDGDIMFTIMHKKRIKSLRSDTQAHGHGLGLKGCMNLLEKYFQADMEIVPGRTPRQYRCSCSKGNLGLKKSTIAPSSTLGLDKCTLIRILLPTSRANFNF